MHLFHCNETDKIQLVLEDENKIDILKAHKDKYWIGTGIYFWDNLGNANYWKNDKIRKNTNIKYSIVRVNVCLDNKLDFTDPDIRSKFNSILESLSGYDSLQKLGFGEQIDYFFENYGNFGNFALYEVIVADGYYMNERERLYKYHFRKKYIPRLTEKNKRVYNVIKNKAILKVIKEEVS